MFTHNMYLCGRYFSEYAQILTFSEFHSIFKMIPIKLSYTYTKNSLVMGSGVSVLNDVNLNKFYSQVYIPDYGSTSYTTDDDTLQYLDSTENIVYVSFGTQNSLSPTVISNLQKVLLQIPHYKFLWAGVAIRVANIYGIQKCDQTQVLKHPNVKMCLFHGGINTYRECISANVPMIVLPFTFDQPYNAYYIHEKELGRSIKFDNVSMELPNAINYISDNYKDFTHKLEKFQTHIVQNTFKVDQLIEKVTKQNQPAGTYRYPYIVFPHICKIIQIEAYVFYIFRILWNSLATLVRLPYQLTPTRQ